MSQSPPESHEQGACPFDNCNQIEGHDGPHGMGVAGGLVFAPYGGGEGMLRTVETDIECDCCGEAMLVLRGQNGGGQLRCTKCNQKHFISASGDHTSTLTTLYPSHMAENSGLFRDYVEYRRSQWLFSAKARWLLGLATDPEYQEMVDKANEVVDDWYANHQVKLPWWKRLFAKAVS